jgi:hypothetical protein
MAITIRKAEKHLRKLRLALIGLSKSGKTLTSLLFARALAGPEGKVGVIDTEGGNSEIYAGAEGVGDFGIVVLTDSNPLNYIEAMNALIDAGCTVVVIDGLSAAWNGRGGVLEIVDNAGGNNKFTNGWGKATPLHNDLISAINNSPVHVIATMRQKAEYVVETNDKGKAQPRKVGMAAVQREGMEYEFDITGDMEDTTMTITGIRGREFEPWKGKSVKRPDAGFIAKIKGLLSDAPVPVRPVAPAPTPVAPTNNGHHHQNGTLNGTSNGHHALAPATTVPTEPATPPSPKAKLWAEIRTWSGVQRSDAAGLADAARRVYTHLDIPANGKATEVQVSRALEYVQVLIMERVDFAEWAGDAKAVDRKYAKLLDGLVTISPAPAAAASVPAKKEPVFVPDDGIAEEDIPF